MSPVQLFFLILLVALLLLIGFVLLILSSRQSGKTVATNTGGRIKTEAPDGLKDMLLPRRTETEIPPRTRMPPSASVDTPPWIDAHRMTRNPQPALRTRSKLYHYTAYVTSVYDGDTLTVDIDLGMDMHRKNQVIRLWKVNTPELRGPERSKGLEVRDIVRELALEKTILLRTILDKRGRDQTGKYGRLLGEIILEDESGLLNLNEYLLAKGLAIPFGADGSAIKPPTPANAPLPAAVPSPGEGSEQRYPSDSSDRDTPEIDCPYCGEYRQIDTDAGLILACPNCMDESRAY